jgi:hypothetical protein
MPVGHGLPAVKELADAALMCTRTGQVLTDHNDAKSLMTVIREYYEEHRSGGWRSLAKEYDNGRDSGVKDWQISEYAGVPPEPKRIMWERAGSSEFGNFLIDRYMLRHSKLLEIPLLHIHKKAGGEVKSLLWFRDGAKASAEDWPELKKYLDEGYEIVSFDFRGMGEAGMKYTAVSPDDPALGKLDFVHAYVNPISGVLADHVYNSLLIGRPYFLQMIEDAEIVAQFTRQKLGAKQLAVSAPGVGYTLASSIAEVLPRINLLSQPGAKIVKWSDLVEQQEEIWPIEYLLPSGAYVH